MKLSEFAISDPDAFVAWCDKLRAAGVMKLGALVLGPKPPVASDRPEADPNADALRKHKVMFASSRITPPFTPPVASESGRPRALVQRQERNGAANGEGNTSR